MTDVIENKALDPQNRFTDMLRKKPIYLKHVLQYITEGNVRMPVKCSIIP